MLAKDVHPAGDTLNLHIIGGYGIIGRKSCRVRAGGPEIHGGGQDMGKKNARDTRGRIISAAWKLFYQQGYESTTVEDIVFESGTSKGSFYHYFDGKDALLGTLAYVFDKKYESLIRTMTPEMSACDRLVYLNHELFAMIDGGVSIDLLTRLLSTQLLARGEKHLLDRNRVYFRLLRQIVSEGVTAGEFHPGLTGNEIVKAYALWERALLYDWCLCGGEYSLVAYSDSMMPRFLGGYRASPGERV
jgi:AcrR family transcriptional regulator